MAPGQSRSSRTRFLRGRSRKQIEKDASNDMFHPGVGKTHAWKCLEFRWFLAFLK
jgi:hypothetical protein